MRKIKNIIFDADGTLLDTNYHYIEVYYKSYQRFGWDIPRYKIHRVVGMGHDKAIPLLTSLAWYKKNCKAFERYSRNLYRKDYLRRARLFPNVVKLLRKLKAAGFVLALASSSPAETVRYYLTLFPGCDLFKCVTTYCDIKNSKPDPDAFLAILDCGGMKKKETVVIGDSIWDMKAARRASLKAIGLLSGGGFGEEELLHEGAVEVYWDPTDLLRRLSHSIIMKS